MRKKREFVKGAFYHVTSRTNNKVRVFENKLGRKIMLITLQDAKDKFRFRLTNFCIMPTHIHLLIQPTEDKCLSEIMHWIKIHSAKRWNFIHGSTDHMWGHRYFARDVKDHLEYESVMNYIDQNPVKAGLAATPAEWKASGAFYRAHGLELVDIAFTNRPPETKLLMPIPFLVSNFLPSAQLNYTMKYYAVYAEKLERLYGNILKIPKPENTKKLSKPIAYFRFYTDTADYFIYEYDKQDTMYGKVRMNVFPSTTEYKTFSLTNLKNTPNIKLDLSWIPKV